MIALIVVCIAVFAAAIFGLAAMGISDAPRVSPVLPTLGTRAGPASFAKLAKLLARDEPAPSSGALAPLFAFPAEPLPAPVAAAPAGRDLPASMRVRAENIRALWIEVGAQKKAEYEAVLDVMAGEQDTAVIEQVSA